MKQNAHQKIITGNDLLSGEVVYLTASGSWTDTHQAASLIGSSEMAEARLAEIIAEDTTVVGPYIADATLNEFNAATPVHFREVFRATGPTNRVLGKQVQNV